MSNYDSHLRPDRGIYPLSEFSAKAAENFSSKPVMRTWDGEGYVEITYEQLNNKIQCIATWLLSQGIKEDDKIAVLGENRVEWSAAYLGILTAGGTVVPVDSMMPIAGIRHILADSESKILFVSAGFISQIAEMEDVKSLEKIICFDDEPENADFSLSEVLKAGEKLNLAFPKRSLDDKAAILYTSGTTGFSKGVMLTHNNIMSNVASVSRIYPLTADDTFLSVLPVHHSFECTAGFLLPLYCGCSITYARSLKSTDIVSGIRDTKVTIMVGVPLLYEKMHEGIVRGITKKGKKTQILFNTIFNAVKAGEKIGLKLGQKLFGSLREKAGLGSIKFFVSGGGPLNPEDAFFFNRLGISLMQGYGLTETSPVTHVTPPWQLNHICVGPPIPGVECIIADPNASHVGEVMVRGPNIFAGYYKNEEATREVMTEDGWFLTGDLGKLHSEEYLQIMGRVKNMLVTGGGKNVYPEEVEHYLNHCRFIAESVVLGVERKSGFGDEVAALIFPDFEQVDLHFEEKGKKATPEDVHKLIKGEIADLQKDIADYKRVRRFKIIEEEFQKTSTKKVKRYLYDGNMLDI